MQLAHSLKGSSANIGANDLREAAYELEKASKDGVVKPPALFLIEKVEAALKQVQESLQSLVDISEVESSHGKKISADPEQLRPLLKQLAEALDLAEPEEIKKHVEALRKHLATSVFQDLENLTNNYDYEKALNLVDRLKAEG